MTKLCFDLWSPSILRLTRGKRSRVSLSPSANTVSSPTATIACFWQEGSSQMDQLPGICANGQLSSKNECRVARINPYDYLSFHLSIYQFASIYQSVYVSVFRSISVTLYLPIYLPVNLSICLSAVQWFETMPTETMLTATACLCVLLAYPGAYGSSTHVTSPGKNWPRWTCLDPNLDWRYSTAASTRSVVGKAVID